MNDYEYWSRLAPTYEDDNLYVIGQATHDAINSWLTGQFENNDHVLELGCGSGLFTEPVVGLVSHVTATDMSDEMLDQARIKFAGNDCVTILKEDCCKTSFDDETFDAVFLANVIHLVSDPDSVLEESHRLLKHGGRLVVVDFTSYGLTSQERKIMIDRYFERWGRPQRTNKALSPETMRSMVEKAGFKVVESILVGDGARAVLLSATN